MTSILPGSLKLHIQIDNSFIIFGIDGDTQKSEVLLLPYHNTYLCIDKKSTFCQEKKCQMDINQGGMVIHGKIHPFYKPI